MDQGLVTIIASISGVVLATFLVALVKVITTFVNKNIMDTFHLSKEFATKSELEKFKDEMKRDLAVERVTLQTLLLDQMEKALEDRIKSLRSIGNKMISAEDMLDELEGIREDFKDKISSYNLIEDKVDAMRKELNMIRYGTDKPINEEVNRRRG